jgi:hypothetical protein
VESRFRAKGVMEEWDRRIERLLAMGLLGSCRHTQLLVEIMELCPDDEEANCFFAFFFLQRLPSWLRGPAGG